MHLVGGKCLPAYEKTPPKWLDAFWKELPDGGKMLTDLSLCDYGDKEKEVDQTWIWGLNYSIRKSSFLKFGGFHPDNISPRYQHFQGDGETGLSLKLKENGAKAWYNPQVIDQLKKGGVVCGPTDTVYGLIGLVSNKEAVEKIYSIKKRDPTKSLIVLISDLAQLNKFGVQQSDIDNASHYWPGRISLILNVVNVADYLTRGKPNLAFRLPESKMLRSLIAKTGPLVAPSANPEGQALSLIHISEPTRPY